jgi:hypothetical protein
VQKHVQLDCQLAEMVRAVHDHPDGVKISDESRRIIKDILGRRCVHLSASTIQVHARRLGVTRHKLLNVSQTFAASTYLLYVHCMRKALTHICDDVKSRGGLLKSFYVFVRYDETPMKMTVLDTDWLYGLEGNLAEQLLKLLPGDALVKDAGVAKLLQTEVIVSALTKVGDTWRLFSWNPPLHIQAMSPPPTIEQL